MSHAMARDPRWTRATAIAGLAVTLAGCAGGAHHQHADPSSKAYTEAVNIARATLRAGEIEAAERLFHTLAASAPKASAGYQGLGDTARARGQIDKATASYREALRHARTDTAAARARLGMALIDLETTQVPTPQTLASLERAAREARDDSAPGGLQARIADARAVAAARRGEHEDAREWHALALAVQPNGARIVWNTARTAEAQERGADVRNLLDRLSDEAWNSAGLTAHVQAMRRRLAPAPDTTADAAGTTRTTPSALLQWQPRAHALATAASEPDPPRRQPMQGPQSVQMTRGETRHLVLGDPPSTVYVTNDAVVDVDLHGTHDVTMIARAIGHAEITLHTEAGGAQRYRISVRPDTRALARRLAETPGLEGVKVEAYENGLSLRGKVPGPEDRARAERIARQSVGDDPAWPVENEITIADPVQVRLDVQIAEVNRTVSERLGVSWELFGNSMGGGYGLRIGRPGLTLGDPVIGRPPRLNPNPELGSGSTSIGWASDNLGVVLDALAEAGLANVLARPSVTAVSGETATFFAGGEHPIPTAVKDGQITYEYKEVGVRLDFTPEVLHRDRIRITVSPEVSEAVAIQGIQVDVGVTIPTIQSRKATTTVEIANGESIVIAGLFRDQALSSESGIPGLKDVPALGFLFGNRTTSAGELELIVTVTAHLVESRSTTPVLTGNDAEDYIL